MAAHPHYAPHCMHLVNQLLCKTRATCTAPNANSSFASIAQLAPVLLIPVLLIVLLAPTRGCTILSNQSTQQIVLVLHMACDAGSGHRQRQHRHHQYQRGHSRPSRRWQIIIPEHRGFIHRECPHAAGRCGLWEPVVDSQRHLPYPHIRRPARDMELDRHLRRRLRCMIHYQLTVPRITKTCLP